MSNKVLDYIQLFKKFKNIRDFWNCILSILPHIQGY